MLRQTGRGPRLVPTRDGRMINITGQYSVRDLIDAGLMFAGTPDQVYSKSLSSSRPPAASKTCC